VVALVSVLVLGITGYAYATLNNGLATDNIINHKSTGPVNVLLVGMDSRTDAQGHPLPPDVLNELQAGGDTGELNTDTMILLHIPADGTRAVGMSLPRDSYVDIADGIKNKHKLNSALARGKAIAAQNMRGQDKAKIEQDSKSAGRRTLIHTIEQLTGLQIDHYAEVNLASFYEITKAIGGVEVCLKAPAKEANSGINLPAGRQTIQGAQALAFVRQRYNLPRSDLDRVVRQQAFLSGLAKKILSGGTLADPTKLNDLINAIKKSVLLDQGWDIAGFAEQMHGLTGGAIHFETMPTEGDIKNTPEDGDALRVDPPRVRDFVKGLVNDQPQSTAPSPAPSTNTGNGSTTADVVNGAGTSKLASNVSDFLVGQGFGKGDTQNGSPSSKSTVYYANGEQTAGKKVANALGGLHTAEDTKVTAGHVRVLLGKDYAGPGTPPHGSAAPAVFQPDTATQPAAYDAVPAPAAAQADGPTCID
jgi:LCP family protein required for cell wall assembly